MNKKVHKIKNNIINIDFILSGTILKKYKQCGKINCRCFKNKKHWHGPYYIWTRKENGKTITKTLTKNQAQSCLKAFKNMKKLNQSLKAWKQISSKNIDRIS